MTFRKFWLFAVLCAAFLSLNTLPSESQTCRWDGTAPICDGSCSGDETEVTRLDSVPSHWTPPFVNSNPPFGQPCGLGSKALCCKMGGLACRWDGTAPFCEGACREGETAGTPPPGSTSGSACWTGQKVYCCRRIETGTVIQRLQTNPDLTRYAAYWERSGGPAWIARHGLTSAQYQQEFDRLLRQGYRPVQVSGYAMGNQDFYAAIWEQRQDVPWAARHGLTSAQYQQAFNDLTRQGYRLVHVSGYGVGGQDRYAAIWEKRSGPAWVARHGLTGQQFQQEFDRLLGQNYRLLDLSGYSVGGQNRYAAIWEQSSGPPWAAHHGMTSAQYQQAFNNYAQQNFRLKQIRGWGTGNDARYAAIWEQNQSAAWIARHGMSSDTYQEEFDRLTKEGYRLRAVSGYHPFN